MFGAIHQHLKQYLIQNFSTHSRREGTITMIIVLQYTGLHFLSYNSIQLSTIFTALVTRLLKVIWYLSSFSGIAFLIKRGKIHVKNTEKSTFLILKDDSMSRTALPNPPFEHLSNQRTKTTLWLVRDTYPKWSDWCKQHATLYTLT